MDKDTLEIVRANTLLEAICWGMKNWPLRGVA